MEKTKDFTELIVWRRAHQFVLEVYSMTSKFPEDERFGMTSQIRKASVSIAANIAEGYAKRGRRDKMRFLNLAQGSLSECRYYLILARDLKYSMVENTFLLLDEVSRLLNSYRRAIGDDLAGNNENTRN